MTFIGDLGPHLPSRHTLYQLNSRRPHLLNADLNISYRCTKTKISGLILFLYGILTMTIIFYCRSIDMLVCIFLQFRLGYLAYRKGTSIRQAPVFQHLRALRKNPIEVYYLDELIIIILHVAGFQHPAIF